MQYQQVRKGHFLARPNRFIAQVELDGRTETVHVKNTGRCRELLVPGATVYVEGSDNPKRKTKYDLIAVEKGSLLINMDAQAPNHLFAEWARAGKFRENLTLLRPETTWGNSRFDFYWEDSLGTRGFVEVKGVTLEEEGLALFPDAPTERGVKHLRELIACRAAGYEAAVCFVVQMAGMKGFSPNERTHPAFGAALREARDAGVEILVEGCTVTPEQVEISHTVPLFL
ncbi:sugar fermentation stimulation protein SfsA [Flavonifractor sp. An92]|uniref:DNA/RNA nuclease SfsA n=1 Tax=Flavonifractor sp. An92 TaxID=1965666 RepID=UPI000B37B8B3|nr:DNA/RNA nuclease SfsA [Flavonifractor sp. An92]OUN03346.1 sugar fermentation stimulation protein SfsA [Flavonifractor sp. An92]